MPEQPPSLLTQWDNIASLTLGFTFYLGRIRNSAHDAELQEVARWLDANKFSCTYSVIDGGAIFDVEPYASAKAEWAKHPPFSKDGFVLYASEYIIHCLSRALGVCHES